MGIAIQRFSTLFFSFVLMVGGLFSVPATAQLNQQMSHEQLKSLNRQMLMSLGFRLEEADMLLSNRYQDLEWVQLNLRGSQMGLNFIETISNHIQTAAPEEKRPLAKSMFANILEIMKQGHQLSEMLHAVANGKKTITKQEQDKLTAEAKTKVAQAIARIDVDIKKIQSISNAEDPSVQMLVQLNQSIQAQQNSLIQVLEDGLNYWVQHKAKSSNKAIQPEGVDLPKSSDSPVH